MHPIVKEDLKRIVTALGSDAHILAGKTIVISGGSGFLGRYFLATFDLLNKTVLERPCRVLSIDNYVTGSRRGHGIDLDEKQIIQIEADIRTPLTFDEPVHFIIHAAGLASPAYYKKYPIETIESTFIGAKNLLELARTKKVESFLFFSSSEIYGDPDPKFIPTPETYRGNVACIGERACYDESKRVTETLCSTYATQYGVPVKMVRPFNVYGPGMGPKDHRVISTFLARGLAGKALPVHSNGAQTRTFCYISDATTGFLKTLFSTAQGQVFNIGNPEPELSMADLAHRITALLNNGAKVEFINYPDTYPGDEPNRRCPDITKARIMLGFAPSVSLDEGLQRMFTWFKETHLPTMQPDGTWA